MNSEEQKWLEKEMAKTPYFMAVWYVLIGSVAVLTIWLVLRDLS